MATVNIRGQKLVGWQHSTIVGKDRLGNQQWTWKQNWKIFTSFKWKLFNKKWTTRFESKRTRPRVAVILGLSFARSYIRQSHRYGKTIASLLSMYTHFIRRKKFHSAVLMPFWWSWCPGHLNVSMVVHQDATQSISPCKHSNQPFGIFWITKLFDCWFVGVSPLCNSSLSSLSCWPNGAILPGCFQPHQSAVFKGFQDPFSTSLFHLMARICLSINFGIRMLMEMRNLTSCALHELSKIETL